MQKKPYNQGFSLSLLLEGFLRIYQQSYTLNVVRLWNSKGSGNLLRFICVSLTNLHTRHDAFAEKGPPAGLSSIHSPILDKV